ncbi:fungal hydrophobin-domain-containing protein [Panaeolus papilionaceus]|nr:fungal hydrophobin-domain-containing protein [Panaeolus papilionaceus]
MFSKVFAILALGAIAVSAGSYTTTSDGIQYSCNAGPVQCCGQLQAPSSTNGAQILSLVGVAAQGLTGQVGAQCNPITAIGAGTGANCASSPVCCEKNFQNQLVGVNCTPATVGA